LGDGRWPTFDGAGRFPPAELKIGGAGATTANDNITTINKPPKRENYNCTTSQRAWLKEWGFKRSLDGDTGAYRSPRCCGRFQRRRFVGIDRISISAATVVVVAAAAAAAAAAPLLTGHIFTKRETHQPVI